MRDAFPLTDFDFWAFLTSGAVILAAADKVFGLGWLARENWTFVQVGLAAALAYVVGHIVAEIASRLLEGWLVQRVLGAPSKLLLAEDAPRPWGYWLFSSYFTPISADLRARIERRAALSEPPIEATALYTNAYILARRDALAASRLSTFQNQYSMCRNVCVASLAAAPALAFAALHAGQPANLWWALAALVVAAVMLVRFLKYYRLYSMEVLNAYAGGAGEA